MMNDDEGFGSGDMPPRTYPDFTPEEIAAERAASDRNVNSKPADGMTEINIDPLPREGMILEGAQQGGTVDIRKRNCLLLAGVAALLAALAIIVGISVPVTQRKKEAAKQQQAMDGTDLLLNEDDLENSQTFDFDTPSNTDDTAPEVDENEMAQEILRAEQILKVLMAISGDIVTKPSTPQYEAANWIIKNDGMQLDADATRLGQRYVVSLLYHQMDGPSWPNRTNFLTASHECQWEGIDCNGSMMIKKIHWNNNSLAGEIPFEIGYLNNVEHLNMEDNFLDGTIPMTIWTNMTKLKMLDLSSNMLSGQIVDQVKNLVNLRELNLHDNVFDGQLNPNLKHLTNLQELKLYGNGFSGPIISELGALTNLKRLDLDDNDFRGTLPSELGQLTQMEILWMNGNTRVSGSIPEEWYNMVNLQKLFVGDMGLSGTLSESIGNWTSMQYLQLKNNNFNGTIPESIGTCTPLVALEADRNQFQGPLPHAIGTLQNLKILYLSENPLGHPIPKTWGTLGNLTTLVASNANLTGQFFSEFGQLDKLEYMLLDRNAMFGPLPQEIGNMASLSHLYLYNNQLTGELPSTLGQLTNLKELVIDQNEFVGTVPTELGGLSNLVTLFVFENNLNGTMPQPVCNLQKGFKLKNLWADCMNGFNCTCCSACCVFNENYRGCFYT